MSEINNEVVLKGTEIKPNTFLISGKETAKLDKNTIYQITKIVINECKDNGKPFIYPKEILEEVEKRKINNIESDRPLRRSFYL